MMDGETKGGRELKRYQGNSATNAFRFNEKFESSGTNLVKWGIE